MIGVIHDNVFGPSPFAWAGPHIPTFFPEPDGSGWRVNCSCGLITHSFPLIYEAEEEWDYHTRWLP